MTLSLVEPEEALRSAICNLLDELVPNPSYPEQHHARSFIYSAANDSSEWADLGLDALSILIYVAGRIQDSGITISIDLVDRMAGIIQAGLRSCGLID